MHPDLEAAVHALGLASSVPTLRNAADVRLLFFAKLSDAS
jgi:hypothetical protein